MKLKPILILFACTIAMGGTSSAEVPSLINYQGRLTGPGGTPASGAKNFELKVYDAQAGGNLLYTEDVGTITLGEGGVYSFQFGGSGTSMATRSETLATTDGTLTVFNHALSATALPGSVAMSDGTFTWSQSAGSSAPANFIGSFIGASGIASAIYIQGAPAAGTPIEVTYQYEDAGIVGALSSDSSHWLELTVNGNVQASRERVLAVPFAMKSSVAERALSIDESKLDVPTSTLSRLIDDIMPLLVDLAIDTGRADLLTSHSLPSHRWEDFPVQPRVEDENLPGALNNPPHPGVPTLKGRHGLIEQSNLLFGWTAEPEALSNRIIERDTRIGQTDNFYIGGWVHSVGGSDATYRWGGHGLIVFYYFDGTVSDEIRIAEYGTPWNRPNPFPEKAVRFVTIQNITGQGGGSFNNCRFAVVLDTTKERSFDMRLEDLPESLHALNCSTLGSASEGKNFADCVKWRVRYTDGTLSDPQDLGSVIQLVPGKTPSHARVMTVPAILQDGSVDITKIIVRLVTK